MASDLEELLCPETQSERCHRHTKGYVKITAIRTKELLEQQKGYKSTDFCVRTINNLLNRLGYTLKIVRKTKPLKRIAETDLIFDNIKTHRLTKSPGVFQLSLDVKDKVKIGQLSRGGKHRQQQHVDALDKDQHWDETLVPLGILEIGTGQTTVVLGDSYETSDFIMDGVEIWYELRKELLEGYHTLELYLDNGPQVESCRTQFINRVMQFACITGLNVHLLYYPPYHSKYNPIERVWAAIEQYWDSTLLITAEYAAQTIRNVKWKGKNPIVILKRKQYQQAVKLTPAEMKKREQFLIRKQNIKYWDVMIKPSFLMGMLFFA